ncbi:MAG: sensor histidine kinase [Candidatus Hodarchaeales archaeon]
MSFLSSVITKYELTNQDIRIYRILCFLSAGFHLLHGFLVNNSNPNDNITLPLSVFLSILLIVVITTSYGKLAKYFIFFVYFAAIIVTLSIIIIAVINNFETYYTTLTLIAVIVLSTVFKNHIHLVVYLALSFSLIFISSSTMEIGRINFLMILVAASLFMYLMMKERLSTRDELKESKEILKTVFYESNDAILFVDNISTEILEANQISHKLFELDHNKELVGITIDELLNFKIKPGKKSEVDGGNTLLTRSDNQTIWKEEIEIITQNGQKWLEGVFKNIYISDRLCTLIRFSEITNRKLTELAKAEFNELQKKFLESTSHELRTPLTSIKGFSEILENRINELTPNQIERCFTYVNKNIDRLERLIADVGDTSKFERGTFKLDKKIINFSSFFLKEMAGYKTLLGNEFDYHNKIDSPKNIRMDEDRISQVFNNIIHNAIKNTPKETRKISAQAEISVDKVKVSISDNGAGIELKNIDSIFKPFNTIETKYSTRGTGLGLYISRLIVEGHEGAINATSGGLNHGATFIIHLPILNTQN